MRFIFGNLIHWRRHSSWQEKLKEKLRNQGIPPLMTIIMEVFLLLDLHNLQGLHHNNWKKKEKKGFVTIVITNTLKVISVLKKIYFTLIVEKRKNRIKKRQQKSIYTRNQPQRKKE